jgi:hypothetical protein
MKKKHYKARWAQAGKPSIANVDFDASHDANAIKQANKIGRELGVSNVPRTLIENGRSVEDFPGSVLSATR